MSERSSNAPASGRLEREVERERQQRSLNHEARAGLSPLDSGRLKDARESLESIKVRR